MLSEVRLKKYRNIRGHLKISILGPQNLGSGGGPGSPDILIKKQKKSQFKLQKSGKNPGIELVVKSTIHKITKPTTIQRRLLRPPPN